MKTYVIEIRYYNIFRHLRPAKKLLNYIAISRTNSDPEVFNRAHQLAKKKVKHLNCDSKMVTNIYFNCCSKIHSAGWLFLEKKERLKYEQ